MSDDESTEVYAAKIREGANSAGFRISEEHALLAAEWRGSYESAVDAVRQMDYAGYEPGSIFVPVTELSNSKGDAA